jgi:Gas vesicle protein
MTLETTTRATAEISLVDLLDRLLGTGVVVVGDVVISLAGIDLVRVQLEALITSVRSEFDERGRADES